MTPTRMNPNSPLGPMPAEHNGKEVPIVAKKFTTSARDGILLERLFNLRDKINHYTDKKVKVNLNVGNKTIGEAVI